MDIGGGRAVTTFYCCPPALAAITPARAAALAAAAAEAENTVIFRMAGGSRLGSHKGATRRHPVPPTPPTNVTSRAHGPHPRRRRNNRFVPPPPHAKTPFSSAADLYSGSSSTGLTRHFRKDRFSVFEVGFLCNAEVVAGVTAAAAEVAAFAAHCGTQGSVDLHGMTVEEALAVVDNLLGSVGLGRNFQAGGTVTLITGVGRHSGAGGPRLLQAVRNRLTSWGAVFVDRRGGFEVSFDADPPGCERLGADASCGTLNRRLCFALGRSEDKGRQQPKKSRSRGRGAPAEAAPPALVQPPTAPAAAPFRVHFAPTSPRAGWTRNGAAAPPALVLPPTAAAAAPLRIRLGRASPRADAWLLTIVVGHGGVLVWVTSPCLVRS